MILYLFFLFALFILFYIDKFQSLRMKIKFAGKVRFFFQILFLPIKINYNLRGSFRTLSSILSNHNLFDNPHRVDTYGFTCTNGKGTNVTWYSCARMYLCSHVYDCMHVQPVYVLNLLTM